MLISEVQNYGRVLQQMIPYHEGGCAKTMAIISTFEIEL